MKSGEMERMPEGAHNSMTGDIAHGADAKEKALIFLHIPKTAGTTLNSIIHRQYAPEVIYNVSGPDLAKSIQKFKTLDESEKRRIRLVRGHMPFGLHRYLDMPATYITMLRDPIDRVISDFYYVFEAPSHPLYQELMSKRVDLADFIRSRVPKGATNGQTRLISGVEKLNAIILNDADKYNLDLTQEPATTDTLEIAKRNLDEHFVVVGLSERFDESLLLLRKALGWRNIYYVKRNVTKNRPSKQQLPRETIRLIEKHYDLDIQLYEHARQRFEETIREQGAVFESELRSFRRNNKLYGTVWRSQVLTRDAILKVKAVMGRGPAAKDERA
jgi:hypothetical protein